MTTIGFQGIAMGRQEEDSYMSETDSHSPKMKPLHHGSFCHSSATSITESSITPVNAASQALRLMGKYSQHFDPKKFEEIIKFDRKELVIGKILGEGSYNVVHEIRSIQVQKQIEHDSNSENSDDLIQIQRCGKLFMASNCLRVDDGVNNARYAIKYLKADTMKKNFYRYQQGVVDIVREAAILSSLSHPNIIKLRALSSNGTDGFANPTAGNYFLVLDRLYETLDQRIHKWAKKHTSFTNKLTKMVHRSASSFQEKKDDFLAKRLLVAYDIAQAIQYLHQRNIIFRDLKPQNIGFDVRGDVKIFDFGLALELFPGQQMDNGLYLLLGGNVGTAIYMAPEVAKNQPYNLSADIYSFGILLWQICTLKDPFSRSNSKCFAQKNSKNGERQEFNKKCNNIPCQLQQLICSCCSDDLFERPTISTLIQSLKKAIKELQTDESFQIIAKHLDDGHYRRRSSTAQGA